MELVQEDRNLKKMPDFIIITAIGQERITEDAFKRGASYYIMKPFNNEMVLNRIKHTLVSYTHLDVYKRQGIYT